MLDLSNAKAQVSFYQGDLQQAEEYLQYVLTFKRYNLPNYEKHFQIASIDVELSKLRLRQAEIQLEQLLLTKGQK